MTEHKINGDLDIALGERKYLPWSASRIDTASCLYKFKKVYLEGTKENSPSLTIGSMSHEVIATLLKEPLPTKESAEAILARVIDNYSKDPYINDAIDDVREMLDYMVEFSSKWQEFMHSHNINKCRIERPYGLTEDMRRAPYKPLYNGQTFIRGIVDLWCYDKETQILYVVDHKTNKSIMSKARVKEHHQLLFYVAMLTLIYGLKWNTAYIALNFLRKGKVVWATVTREDILNFMKPFLNTLRYLEEKLWECDESLIWPTMRSFKCSWCTFKDTCNSYDSEV